MFNALKSPIGLASTLVFCSGLLLLPGCAAGTGGIATSNIPLQGKPYRVLGPGRVERTWHSVNLGIVGFPLSEPPISSAMAQLMKSKGGDALINIRYGMDKRVILLAWTIHRFYIEADVIKLTPASAKPRKRGRKRRRYSRRRYRR